MSQICSQLQIRYAGFKTAGPHQIACWANRARQAAEIAAGAELIESARAHVLWTFLFTDAELAQLFNVSVHTIPDWKKRVTLFWSVAQRVSEQGTFCRP